MENNTDDIAVLLIEDHPGDARLTQEALRGLGRPIHLHHAWDGDEAMAFLRREGIQVNAPRPSIILLDLSMPRMCGRETLALIKRDTMLRAIPVIILTNFRRRSRCVGLLSTRRELLSPKACAMG
jgi:two-component system, chemotaxis family, response regulator Rcp1